MITFEAPSATEAAKQAFLRLYDQAGANSNDPALLREDAAAIVVAHPGESESAFAVDENTGRFSYVADYAAYIVGLDPGLIGLEEAHYTEILGDGQLDPLVRYLSQSPSSRRSLLSTWLPQHADPERPAAPCLTQLHFRRRNSELEVHGHFRANDAYRLLLMDVQLATSVQCEVAGRLGMRIGQYVHFVDSLHFYKKDQPKIEAQRAHLLASPLWRGQA